MALIGLHGVHKTYRDKHLLRGVALHVAPLEHVGLLGPNGGGKSTLLRILAGVETADVGDRTVRRDLRIGFLEQEPALAPEQTVRDAVRAGLGDRALVVQRLGDLHHQLGDAGDAARLEQLLREQARLEDALASLGGHDVEHRVEEVLAHLGLGDPGARCGALSGGEQRRVALGRVLLGEPDLLLLDEPTNHLDAQATLWLEEWLCQSRAALVMATHDRYFLDRVVDRIIELDRGELFFYDGGYGDYLVQRAHRLELEEQAEGTRLNLLRRETAWMRRGPPARTTKAKARIDRYHGLVDAAPAAARTEVDFEIPPGPRLGDRVLELRGVGKDFAGRTVLQGIDLEIGPGDRVGIVGPNGAGKTTLLNLCTGALLPDRGTVSRGPTVRFAVIDQQRAALDPGKTVLAEVAHGNDHVFVGGRALRIETFLERFLFPGPMMHAQVGDLSGGERNRVLLAKLLSQGGNVLVLDEPTNDLDLMTLRVLEDALVAFAGAALVVSHDRYFLDRVATRILLVDGRGRARVHEGDLSLLLELLAREEQQQKARERAVEPAPAMSPASPERLAPRKLSSRERAEAEALPGRIEAAEAELAAIDLRLADPRLYERPDAARTLAAERAAAQGRIDALYARWAELDARG